MPHDATVRVGADTSALNSGLAAAKEAVSSFKDHAEESFKEAGKELLGAFAVTALIEGAHGLVEQFGEIADQATRMNTTAEALQRIAYAAKLSGTNLDTVIKGLEKTGYNAQEALSGNEKLSEAFEKLGINAAEFIDLQPEQQLLQLSKAFEEAEHSGVELKNAYRDVLGKASGELLPLLKEGPEKLKEMFNSATVASNETVAKLKEDEDKLEGFWMSFKAVAVEALSAVVDTVKVLWGALGVVGTFLANLPDGFKAATEAADEFGKELYAQQQKEKHEREERLKPGKNTDVDALISKANAESKKKAEEDIAKIREENAKKEEDAHFRNLSLLAQKAELEEKIAVARATMPLEDALGQEKAWGKILDMQKELEGVNREVSKEKEQEEKKLQDELKKQERERTREELKEKKDALREAQKTASELEKAQRGFTVDSLRQIGGGLRGVNYNLNAAKDDMQRQQLDYARQQVEKLSQVVDALEKTEQQLPQYDGSFS